MNSLRTLSLSLALAALAGTLAAPLDARTTGQATGHAVGDFFPDVELPTIDGSATVRLSSLRGQRLLLIEFASW